MTKIGAPRPRRPTGNPTGLVPIRKRATKRKAPAAKTQYSIKKKWEPTVTTVQQDKNRKKHLQEFWKDTKKASHAVVKGIVKTADFVGKAAEVIEPWIDAAVVYQPELAPLAALDTSIAETHKFIKRTADATAKGKDGWKAITNTGPIEKSFNDVPYPPRINMLTNQPYGNYAMTARAQVID